MCSARRWRWCRRSRSSPWSRLAPDIKLFGRTIPLVVADVNVGLLYVLAIASVGTYGIILGGWASNNKYSLAGRAAHQLADAVVRAAAWGSCWSASC